MNTSDEIQKLITRGVEKIFPSNEEFEKVLRSGKKLRLYQGFDPSMSSLHLGNFVGLMKLRQFQKLGHEVIFLVGDFTGMIGDPTDKSATRKMLTREETIKNSQTWKTQVSKVLDFSGENPVKFMFNSLWLDKISFKDLINITSNFTVQQMMERDMFQDRIKENKPIHLHEFLYPVAQAVDCVDMDVDLEIGGNDQTFNMLTGRTLMKALKNKEKYVLTTKLLVDANGMKIGKTTGNALFLDSTPENFYGGIMSFPDEVIGLSFELLTEIPLEGIEEKIKSDPMGEKKHLAYEIVTLLWGEGEAQKAQKSFENTFQNRDVPDTETKSVKSVTLENLLIELGFTASKSESKRIIQQGGIDIDGKKIIDPNFKLPLNKEVSLKSGKTKFAKIRVA